MLRAALWGMQLGSCILLASCAHSPVNDPSDPFEDMNRKFFSFNQGLDDYVARPIARGYKAVVPEPARDGIGNFIGNVTYPTVIANDALQGKAGQFFEDVGRILFNTIVGLGGFVDAASMIGLEEHQEDFGQTLGYWGFGNGAFLMLPFYGPSSNRELAGTIGGFLTSPTTFLPGRIAIPFDVTGVVDTRAELLEVDGILEQQLDRYIFVRNAYLQRRQSLVYDGAPPIDPTEFDDDEAEAEAVTNTRH